jgi:hypothetical protein
MTDPRPMAPGAPSALDRAAPAAGDATAPAPARPAPPPRDRIVVIGRRRAGKTIYLARLYEALWQGCTLVDGRIPAPGEPIDERLKGDRRRVVEMTCRATSGAAHTQFMRVIEELHAGRWPAATLGSSYAELLVTYAGRERLLTALDYPGEVFRKAFMHDSGDPDAAELLAAIDRAAAAIFLIDPAVVAAGGEEAHEDTFGLTQAASRIRQSPGGERVPIAVVLTKTDLNRALLREAGGVREFTRRHFGQMFRSLESASVFASVAVRIAENALGKSVPRADRPAENVVEPLRYCFEMMDAGADQARIREAQRLMQESQWRAAQNEKAESARTTNAWVIFTVAVALLFAVVGVVTWFAVKG